MKSILTSGAQIVETKKMFDALGEELKAKVDAASKQKLADAVENYIGLVKSGLSRLNEQIKSISSKEAKQVLEEAKVQLGFAKELGISGNEYNFYLNHVEAVQKQLESKNLVDVLTVESVNGERLTVSFSDNVPVSFLSTVDTTIAETRNTDEIVLTLTQDVFTDVITRVIE